jgi:hypothetical protein
MPNSLHYTYPSWWLISNVPGWSNISSNIFSSSARAASLRRSSGRVESVMGIQYCDCPDNEREGDMYRLGVAPAYSSLSIVGGRSRSSTGVQPHSRLGPQSSSSEIVFCLHHSQSVSRLAFSFFSEIQFGKPAIMYAQLSQARMQFCAYNFVTYKHIWSIPTWHR